jgi:site-specific DNA-methyltransferase (adenine-specific)
MDILRKIPDNFVDLIYIDPPFNTGIKRKINRIKVKRTSDGNRSGFGDNHYSVVSSSESSVFEDKFTDYIEFLRPRLEESRRILKETGSFYLHVDYREVHYVKILMDRIFGRENFLNEIIWSYDYGARSKRKWSSKHDNILFYVKNNRKYYFDYDSMERVPYLAPKLVGEKKAAKGKTLTDSFFLTIVPTNSKERVGYPTQKPVKLLSRLISVSCPPSGIVLDYFAGSGTTGVAAALNARKFILVDNNIDAIEIINKRLNDVLPGNGHRMDVNV